MSRPWNSGQGELSCLYTKRLCLRPFDLDDVKQTAALAGDVRIARMTSVIPHPYTQEDARSWIAKLPESYDRGDGPTWAITASDSKTLVGCIGITLRERDQVGVLGYWTGVPFWRHGYTSEAAAAVIAWAYQQRLPRVSATVLADNLGSHKILQRLGFKKEGVLRADALRDGERIDVHCYGLLLAIDDLAQPFPDKIQ